MPKVPRESITVSLDHLDARSLGALIALFERAVGLYAEWIDVNAYDQPGVEAGKVAAAEVLDLQRRATAHLRAHADAAFTAEQLADAIGSPDSVEVVFHILQRAASNPNQVVRRIRGDSPSEMRFGST